MNAKSIYPFYILSQKKDKGKTQVLYMNVLLEGAEAKTFLAPLWITALTQVMDGP